MRKKVVTSQWSSRHRNFGQFGLIWEFSWLKWVEDLEKKDGRLKKSICLNFQTKFKQVDFLVYHLFIEERRSKMAVWDGGKAHRTGVPVEMRWSRLTGRGAPLCVWSACRCAIFTAFWDTSMRPKNIQFFGGVLVQRQKRNLRPQPRTHAGGATIGIVAQKGHKWFVRARYWLVDKLFSQWVASRNCGGCDLSHRSFYPAPHHDDDTAPYVPIGSPSLTASLVWFRVCVICSVRVVRSISLVSQYT